MSGRRFIASSLMACGVAIGGPGIATAAGATPAIPALAEAGRSVRSEVIEIARRSRGPRIRLPLGPAYIYYDYPYYYSRGHYPTHIGGYVYYPSHPYGFTSSPRYGARCSDGSRKCVAGWSYERGPGPPRRHRARKN